MRLINLVPPVKYESLRSYLARLGKANYYEERNWVNALIGLPRQTRVEYLFSEVHLTRLSELVRLSVQSLRSMTLDSFVEHFYLPEPLLQPPSEEDGNGHPRLWTNSGRTIFINGTYSRDKICPLCLQENDAALLPWLLRPVTACPTHQILLLDTCSTCRQHLKLNKGACAKCGMPVSQMPVTPIHDDTMSINVTRLIWTAIGCSDGVFPLEEGFPLTELSPPAFLQLLWRLGALLLEYDSCNPYLQTIDLQQEKHNIRRSIRQFDAWGSHQIVKAAYELLTDWPVNWHRALGRILQGEEVRRNASRTRQEAKRQSFPYALHVALRNITAWGWLWDSWAEFTDSCDSHLAGIRYWRSYLDRNRYIDNRYAQISQSSALRPK